MTMQTRERRSVLMRGHASQLSAYNDRRDRIKADMPVLPTFHNTNEKDLFQLQRDIEQTKVDLADFRNRVRGLAKQTNELSTNLVSNLIHQ